MKAKYQRAESQRPDLAKPFVLDQDLQRAWQEEQDNDGPTVQGQWRDMFTLYCQQEEGE